MIIKGHVVKFRTNTSAAKRASPFGGDEKSPLCQKNSPIVE
jgi:hypothetical protein